MGFNVIPWHYLAHLLGKVYNRNSSFNLLLTLLYLPLLTLLHFILLLTLFPFNTSLLHSSSSSLFLIVIPSLPCHHHLPFVTFIYLAHSYQSNSPLYSLHFSSHPLTYLRWPWDEIGSQSSLWAIYIPESSRFVLFAFNLQPLLISQSSVPRPDGRRRRNWL